LLVSFRMPVFLLAADGLPNTGLHMKWPRHSSLLVTSARIAPRSAPGMTERSPGLMRTRKHVDAIFVFSVERESGLFRPKDLKRPCHTKSDTSD